MKTPDFIKKQAAVLADFQSLISEKPPASLTVLYQISRRIFKGYDADTSVDLQDKHNANGQSSTAGAQNANAHPVKTAATAESDKTSEQKDSDNSNGNNGEDLTTQTKIFYFHVMSKCHVDAYVLERAEAKEIFELECLHYARVCEIAITNYCIMDNHFHLNVGVSACSLEEAREKVAKMMGSIKQQFTRRFKLWYNTVYRKEIRYRKPKLGTGTLWAGPIRAEFIKDDAQLAASTLYTEANRIKVNCAEQIKELSEPPIFSTDPLCKNFGVQLEYEPLLDTLYKNQSQSARFYLGDAASHANTALTDGLDGNWASEEEVKKHWNLPAYSLPKDWRKVHYDNQRRILKPTLEEHRTYHTTPFIERLGQKPATRRRNFVRLVLGMCWKSRERIVIADKVPGQQTQGPGVTCKASAR